MLKIYCIDCGAPTQYSGTIPSFCCSCGQPFNKNVSKASIPRAAPPAVTSKKKRIIEEAEIEEDDMDDDDDYDDGSDDDRPAIEPLSEAEIDDAVEIEVAPPRKLKIEDIARGEEGNKPVPFKGGKASKMSKKAFQKQWAEEAGNKPKGNR